MQRAMTTIGGYVGADPVVLGKEGGTPAVTLRVAYTPHYFQSSSNQWQERPTVWLTVKAFKALARNVQQSVHKGDAVIVTGSLATDEWTKDGQRHSQLVLEATAIGHDLSLGTAIFTRKNASQGSGNVVLGSGLGNGQTRQANQEMNRESDVIRPSDPFETQNNIRQPEGHEVRRNQGEADEFPGSVGM